MSVVDQPAGTSLLIKLITGTAEIDGHPLAPGKLLSYKSGHPNYFIHSWTGCTINITTDSTVGTTESAYIRRIKSSGLFHETLDLASKHQRVLVLDSTHNTSVMVANYMYRSQDSTNPFAAHMARSVYMLNLDCKSNGGSVVCMYKLNGTIPPHHTLDHLTTHKHMFWLDEGGILNSQSMKALSNIFSNVESFVVHMNYTCSSQEDIKTVLDCASPPVIGCTTLKV